MTGSPRVRRNDSEANWTKTENPLPKAFWHMRQWQ